MNISVSAGFTARARKFMVAAVTIAATSLAAGTAGAVGDGGQDKPQLKVEAERSPQGARLTLNGKGFSPMAQIALTATRAPGSTAPQDFGMVDADSTGKFQLRKVAGCTTNSDDVAREQVTFTAADSVSGTKVTTKVSGAAWNCM